MPGELPLGSQFCLSTKASKPKPIPYLSNPLTHSTAYFFTCCSRNVRARIGSIVRTRARRVYPRSETGESSRVEHNNRIDWKNAFPSKKRTLCNAGSPHGFEIPRVARGGLTHVIEATSL